MGIKYARDIGLAQASLRTIDTSSPGAFDWDEYLLRESFIRYATMLSFLLVLTLVVRLCSYICNIDASYALFFGSPPRLLFSELVMELTSPESCFQAQSKEECFIELKCWRNRSGLKTKNLTIVAAVEALSTPATMSAASTRQIFAHLSVLNMFTIIHALYLQLHHVQASGLRTFEAIMESPLTAALRQWKDIWSSPSRDAELADFTRQESRTLTAWRSIGFIRHAPEYWLLAYLSLQKCRDVSDAGLTSGAITRCEDLDMREAKDLLAELKGIDVGYL
jgi:hypothetical protein